MVKRSATLLATVGLLVALGFLIWQQARHSPQVWPVNLDIAELIDNRDGGFLRPDGQWSFRFPHDHAAHPGFHSEVWSVKGHFRDSRDRHFSFQFVVLRLALKPGMPQRGSAWATNQIYVANFALTDLANARFETEERIARAALGLSGASEEPVQVWVEDWSLTSDGKQGLHLAIAMDGYVLRIELHPAKPSLEQGALDLVGLGAGGNSGFHFYLMSRLDLTGTQWSDETARPISGHAWLDRAWGDVPVPRGQVALDRFSLQLDDGRDLLCLRLHRRDGSGIPIPSCVLIGVDGSLDAFRRRDIRLEPAEFWHSPIDGTRYPIAWDLGLSRIGLDLSIRPMLRDQELNLALRTWSGAVGLDGGDPNGRLSGWGFVELSGYAKQNPSESTLRSYAGG